MTKPNIKYSTVYNEYRCTGSSGFTYYTSDKEDAINTLAQMESDPALEVAVKRATVAEEDSW